MDAETKATPGPWKVEGPFSTTQTGPARAFAIDGGGLTVASVSCNLADDQEACLADARLIAAAPDLLDALRMTERTITQMAPWSPDVAEGVGAILGIARAAIAKATVTP